MIFSDNSISHDVTTDAGFRAWGAKIREALEAVGLVRTGDSGQINFASVSAPAINTMAGYDIFRFNDADQATEPVFIKLEYGKSNNTARPALQMTVGKGSNGSGTLTTANGVVLAASTSSPSGNGVIVASHARGGLCLYVNNMVNGGSASSLVALAIVERIRDPETFEVIPDALYAYAGKTDFANGSHSYMVNDSWSNDGASSVAWRKPTAKQGGRLVFGTIAPWKLPGAIFQSVLSAKAGDVALGESGNIPLHGENRPYIRMPLSTADDSWGSAGGSCNLLIPNES